MKGSYLVMLLTNMPIKFLVRPPVKLNIAVDVTFDESDGSQKEQINAKILGKKNHLIK